MYVRPYEIVALKGNVVIFRMVYDAQSLKSIKRYCQ